ncbi:ESF1 homolog [Clinocottus analis]|uniref:ESF1 homolog n=1 Tax=Clinocottus analis TaxID=304258 RepID=UPI0035C02F14
MSSKKQQQQQQQGGDERFARVQKDPRFWEMPEREHKIKIDKRFQSMFHDKRFTEKYTVDKRGRPINETSTEDLKRFYKLTDSEEDDDGDVRGKKKKKGKEKLLKEKLLKEKLLKEKLLKEKLLKEKLLTADGEAKRGDAGGQRPERGVRVIEEKEDNEEEEEEEEEDRQDRQLTGEEEDDDLGDLSVTDDSEDEDDDEDDDAEDESGSEEEEEEEEEDESDLDSDSDSEPDLARGKGNVETSSDEDDEDSDVDAILRKEEAEIEHDWGELAKDARRSDEVSARLAVCNMDWDRIKAKDLLALINSFVPKEGAVLSVKVFPSEFGKERLKSEQTKGPLELKALPDDSEDDNEEERGYREKMRDYQFKRLKYFYAVVECDSADTAARVYQECDGYEYESSCSVLDLRFIPDEVQFDEEPRDVATDVNLSAYEPKLFTSSANATSKVQLTWDETDNDRVSALSRKFNKDELLAMDFNAYLASSSEEEEEEEEESGGGGAFVFGEQESEDEEEDDAAAEAEEPVAEEKKPQKKNKKERKKRSEEQVSKYRELLKGIRVKEKKLQEDKDMEMEITWVPGLKETTEQLVKKKLEGTDKATPWEEFLQKKKDKKKQKKSQRKEGEDEEELSDEDLPPDVDLSDPFFAEELAATDTKKKQKWKKKKRHEEEERTPEEEEELRKQKAEMALLMEDEGDEADHKHFNYDQIVEQQNLSKQKRKKLLKKGAAPPEGDDFQVDVKDPRFQAMFTSHLFNLDPSNPNYKKTKATQSILAEKQRRRGQKEVEEEEERRRRTEGGGEQEQEGKVAGRKRENDSSAPTDEGTSKKSMDPSLSLLIKSIKSKTEQFQTRKKQKLV